MSQFCKGRRLVLSLIALIVLASASVFPASAAEGLSNFTYTFVYTENRFTDVPATSWYAESVSLAYELGLMTGTSDSEYSPDSSITVSQTLAIAARIHSTYYNNGASFKQGKPWYQVYVDYAVENFIIEDGQFSDYSADITRAQFVSILSNSMPSSEFEQISSVEADSIQDVAFDAEYADAVYLFYRAGVLTGDEGTGDFKPDDTIKRSEVAAILSRMIIPQRRVEFTLAAPRTLLYSPDARVISVLSGSVEQYSSGTWSETFAEAAITETGDNWEYGSGCVYFTAPVALTVSIAESVPEKESVCAVYVKHGADTISDCVFESYTALETVELSDTVTTVGNAEFGENLTRIGIPSSVTSIAYGVFNRCSENLMIYCEEGSYAARYADANDLQYTPAVPVYRDDGRCCMVSEDEMPLYLDNGWRDNYADTLTVVYKADGSGTTIQKSDKAKYLASGWYGTVEETRTYVYQSENVYKQIQLSELEAYLADGWKTTPSIVEEILTIADGEVGELETPKNSNNIKYNTWYYKYEVEGSAYPWCMVFVQWVFTESGYVLPYRTASCSGLLNWYKENDPTCIVKTPQRGDIVIYNFGHTGIVESVCDNDTIIVIEGNTSGGSDGSQSEGDGVYRRTRSTSLVTSYIRPYNSENFREYLGSSAIDDVFDEIEENFEIYDETDPEMASPEEVAAAEGSSNSAQTDSSAGE